MILEFAIMNGWAITGLFFGGILLAFPAAIVINAYLKRTGFSATLMAMAVLVASLVSTGCNPMFARYDNEQILHFSVINHSDRACIVRFVQIYPKNEDYTYDDGSAFKYYGVRSQNKLHVVLPYDHGARLNVTYLVLMFEADKKIPFVEEIPEEYMRRITPKMIGYKYVESKSILKTGELVIKPEDIARVFKVSPAQ